MKKAERFIGDEHWREMVRRRWRRRRQLRDRGLHLRTALLKQFPQNRPVAAFLVLTVAPHRKVCVMRKSRQHIQFPAPSRFFHLVLELPAECRPSPIIRRRQCLLHQFGARREIWKPHVIVIELGEIGFGDTAWGPPYRADPQTFVSLPWRAELHDEDWYKFTARVNCRPAFRRGQSRVPGSNPAWIPV